MRQIDDIDETLPDVVKNFLRSGATLEEIRLDANGNWTHEGLDFENERIIELFNRSVARTDGGTWVLVIGRFTYPIEVEDTGYFVERLHWTSAAGPTLSLSDHTEEPLDPDTLEYRPHGRLYCRIREGQFRARFKKTAYYDLADRMEERDGGYVVNIGGVEFPIR